MTEFQASRAAAIGALEAWQSAPVAVDDDEALAALITAAEAEAELRLDSIQLELCAVGLAVRENDCLLDRNGALIAENLDRLLVVRALLRG